MTHAARPVHEGQLVLAPLERTLAIEALHQATAIYTAEPVVQKLLDRIGWPTAGRRLLDASCGDGAFLYAALQRLLAARPHADHDYICRHMEGWEIHPAAAQQAQGRLADLLRLSGWTMQQAQRTARQVVVNDDFLTGNRAKAAYHIIAGNPPYLRYANIPPLLREEYEDAIPPYATKDLLHSFLSRCVEALHPDGTLALVTADRWLFNIGAATLRHAMGSHVGIDYMERLDPTSTFYRAKTRTAGTLPRVHPVAIVMKAGKARMSLGHDAIYPDDIYKTTTATHTLSQIATVKICPWLGKDGIFVVGPEKAATLPAECLVPAVDTDDIRDGTMQQPRRFAIRTTPGVEPPAPVAKHLREATKRLCPTGKRHRDWWLPPETWHNLPLEKERLLVPRIAKGLRSYRLPRNTLAINHNLTVIASDGTDLAQIEAILNSREAQEWVQNRAARLENGYLSITTTLLRQLPVHMDGLSAIINAPSGQRHRQETGRRKKTNKEAI